jgi:hypothetical protein
MTEATAVDKKVNPNIINGRMPVAVVAQIRFGNNKNDTTKELAALYGTTVGKIDDIKKNRNFAYIGADFKPTQEQIDQGIEWLKRHPKYNEGVVDKIIRELETTPVATAEEAAKFEADRIAARGQSVTTKDGAVANGGGGNRRKPKAKKVEEVETPVEGATADALLA